MRLWMIVTEPALRVLERDGELVADGRRTSRDFRPAYRWMAEQMTARIGPPPRPGALPLWAWAQWLGPKQRQPDMRYSGHQPRGTACFRLALDMPDAQVLLSDFDDWHAVLNGWHLSQSEADADAFDADLAAADVPWGWPYPEPFRSRVIGSWTRVFDLDRSGRDPAWHGDSAQQSIQATLWRLAAGQVGRIERFTAR